MLNKFVGKNTGVWEGRKVTLPRVPSSRRLTPAPRAEKIKLNSGIEEALRVGRAAKRRGLV